MQLTHSPLALLAIIISVTGALAGNFTCPDPNASQALCLKTDLHDPTGQVVTMVKPYGPTAGSYECPPVRGAQEGKCCLRSLNLGLSQLEATKSFSSGLLPMESILLPLRSPLQTALSNSSLPNTTKPTNSAGTIISA
ncbi:putative signal peptide protein [Puccinia sorghi]|uniref:Putative signal peptide protein n=1 Tax=Puccinia sorghi TaxID=27349 RepID=A0A0L6V286_9BASI|nr:putative signal peptide protein [Puccinia sorghi]